ncbi:MAG: phytanoyl-CoA dioxygenase family protein [Ilumatobacteraceae bacterium]
MRLFEKFQSPEKRADSVLERADGLVSHGRFDDAIEALETANLEHPDIRLERRIIQLRHQAFFTHRAVSSVREWPPAADDLFPDATSIPEVDARDLTVAHVRSGVLRHGALIVRGVFDPEQVALLADDVRRAVASFDEKKRDDNPWYHPLEIDPRCTPLTPADRHWTRSTGGCFAADSPRSMVHYLAALRANGLIDIVEGYLGERPALSVKKTTLREVPPRGVQGWHQDGAFLGEGIRTLNLWLALTRCGTDAPTMDMIPRRLHELAPAGVEGAAFDWSVSDTVAERVAGDRGIQRLHFEAGDIILFDEMNLHRTAVSPEMTSSRLAIEAWFFAPSCYPLPQLPVLV